MKKAIIETIIPSNLPVEPRHKFLLWDPPRQKMSADMMHFGGDTWLVTFAKKLGRVGGTDRVIEKLRKIFFTENLGEKPNIKFFTVDP